VLVGVGSSSALSFKYDLWSVRQVQREQLQTEERFAIAPPTGISPYGGGADQGGGEAELANLDDGEIRRPEGHPDSQETKRVAARDLAKDKAPRKSSKGDEDYAGAESVSTTGSSDGRYRSRAAK